MKHLLDNITWNALAGPQACFAEGHGSVRRYARGFSPILGFADPDSADFAALEPFCEHGEHFYTDGWSGPEPAGWRIEESSTMYKMIWDSAAPPGDDLPEAVRLGTEHAPQALALAELTRPGPFGIRTIELGEYFGVFEHGQLVAMAGERMHAGTLREISGVCTHPSQQGRGLARKLMHQLMRRQIARGEIPFLHVMSGNTVAHELYLRMGFTDYRETVVRVVAREA